MKKTKKSKKNDRLTVLGLLGAISYWGVTARVLLASVFIWFAYILNISHIGTAEWREFDAETIFLIFGLSTLLVADLGYTVAARALPIHKNTDRLMLIFGDLVLAGFFIAPSLLIMSVNAGQLRLVALILALLVVSVRVLMGLLYGKRK